MNNLKQKFSNHANHYQLFLLAYQICLLISAGLVIKFALEVVTMGGMAMSVHIIPMTLGGLGFIAVQFVGSLFVQKSLPSNNVVALVIFMVLSLICVCSILFPIGLFGLWCVTNKSFRETYFVENRPLWLSGLYEQVEKYTSPKNAN